MNCSFESFDNIYETGLITTQTQIADDLTLIPKKGKQGSPFLNNYNIKVLQKNIERLPEKLSFLIPFIKVQKTVSSNPSDLVDVEMIDTKTWQFIWNHISLLYTYSAHLNAEDPWENSLLTKDDFDSFELFDLKLFYDNYDVTDASPLDIYLLNNFRLPQGYVQKALVKKEMGEYLSKELFRLFSKYKSLGNPIDEEFLGKISKWPIHLARTNVMEFIEGALSNWSKNLKLIDPVRLTTLYILFTLDCYYSRLDVVTTLKRARDFMRLFEVYRKHIVPLPKANISLFFALSKLQDIVKTRQYIRFFPDYLKLTRLCVSMYDYIDTSSSLSERWLEQGTASLSTEYLRVGIDHKNKPDHYELNINAKSLGQISDIPPYLFKSKVKDLLLCNAELMQFTERYLNIDPVIFYKDLKQARSDQHYNIHGSRIIDDLVRVYEEVATKSILENK